MINFILNLFRKSMQQENLSQRGERMLPAAFYGALAATAFVLSNSLVNVYSFPNLPLGVDWVHLFWMWAGFSAAFGMAGVISGWFVEEYQGIVGGGAVMTALLAVAFFFQLGAEGQAVTVQSMLMAVPLIGVSMAAAAALRWAARRHIQIVHEKAAPRRLAEHILVIASVGLVIGILGRMDLPSEQTLTKFHAYLQAAPNDPSALVQLPVKQVPSLSEHFGVDYRFYARRSAFALGSLDLTVRFADGFALECTLPVGSLNFFTNCWERK